MWRNHGKSVINFPGIHCIISAEIWAAAFFEDVKDAFQGGKVMLCLRVRARVKRLCPAEAHGS